MGLAQNGKAFEQSPSDTSLKTNTIIWGKFHIPPVFILRGTHKGRGTVDQFISYLEKHLPTYSHESYEANISRILNDMTNGRPVCSVMLKNTKRTESLYFSMPAILNAHHRLFFVRENIARIENILGYKLGASISLEDLLSHSDTLKAGLVAQRAFHPLLDKVLDQHKEKIFYRYGAGAVEGIFMMMKKKRIDYTIEYPSIQKYVNEVQQSSHDLVGLPIKELPLFVSGYVACTKSEWGKKTIHEINKLLSEHRTKPEFQKIMEYWSTPEDIALMQSAYPAFYNKKK
ncbi:TIGR02285 family protein [Temperatibacter marinus]|uniref:TIGR02285 family protein n=1 Tax=Temperatibacter marinus TaxID=1456591 RepID=A0AA52EFR6_9PROT|nr:TIGR02285 family protein [Temperatibacter marinus]WND01499.1 TIGR02285 family protein [Temperatibacter marinus]